MFVEPLAGVQAITVMIVSFCSISILFLVPVDNSAGGGELAWKSLDYVDSMIGDLGKPPSRIHFRYRPFGGCILNLIVASRNDIHVLFCSYLEWFCGLISVHLSGCLT